MFKKSLALTLTICAASLQQERKIMKKLTLLFLLMMSLIIACGEDNDLTGPPEEDAAGDRFTLIFPLGDTLNTLLPSFAWRSAMGDVEEYRITISTSESMESPVYTRRLGGSLVDTSFTLPSFVLLTNNLKYYWTVSAYDMIVVDYETEIQPIFTVGCTASGCHGNGTDRGGLNLEVGASFDEITGSNTTNNAPLVIAKNPFISPLIWKLEGEDNEGNSVFGSRMPINPSGSFLSQAVIDRIRKWIAQGAKFSIADSVGRFALSDTSYFVLDKQ